MATREEAAKAAGVNAHYVSDARFILQHGSQEMQDALRDGTMGMQEALRALGRRTQRERYREQVHQTLDLAEAVLNDEHDKAKLLAAQIVLRRDALRK